MTKFGHYLKKLRETKSHHSQTSLAKAVNVSQRYISQIEIGKSPPPTYALCLKLSKELNLNEQEKSLLLNKAAMDRFESIKANKPFIHYLSLAAPSQTQNKTVEKMDFSSDEIQLCRYFLSWHTLFEKKLLTGQENLIETQLRDIISEFNYQLRACAVSDTTVALMIDTDLSINLSQFIEGIKEMTSHSFKTNNPSVNLPAKSIWAPKTYVLTLNSMAEEVDIYECLKYIYSGTDNTFQEVTP